MFSSMSSGVLCVIAYVIIAKTCTGELPAPPASLYLYSPGELEYADVLVRRINENLTLVCELRGEASNRTYVWNFVPANGSKPVSVETQGPSERGTLSKFELQPSDSGQYMCSSPPFSVTKKIVVQTKSLKHCARGAFSCGTRCVLPAYVCDGRADCLRGEDESLTMCDAQPCLRQDKLNCSSGRCIPAAACCGSSPLCVQPTCCNEYPRFTKFEVSKQAHKPDGYMDLEVEFPPTHDDRHAPDEYGFIQSTIYSVTACALIFMLAVVLLVSAICKMHMKRAALRSYANAERATRHHYNMQYAQALRFPPCYEASRLLDQDGRVPTPGQSPHSSPTRLTLQCTSSCPPDGVVDVDPAPEQCGNGGFGLARLSSIFSSRYRQVPTQCCEVEMTAVRSTSLNNSPTHSQSLNTYRSPTYCDLNSTEFYFTNPEASNCGRDLNSMATPVEFFRRRALRRNTLERVMDQLGERQRPFTLQLGRFQLSIPKFGRRASSERRPDTPNVAEINIDDLDFVRLNSNETYTLNGRTIRLLGANFENYPVLADGTVRPPPYTEAMRYKLYGPPPEYLSRDGLNANVVNTENNVDEEARNNVEMPPNYDELASGVDSNANTVNNATNSVATNVIHNVASNVTNNGNDIINNAADNVANNTLDNQRASTSSYNSNVETINSVIDNLPAIDSDVNANEATETSVLINNVNNVTVISNGNE